MEKADQFAMMSMSVLILTLNEQLNMKDCINSLPWQDDICVLDSGSSDRTIEIARQSGASVYEHTFEGYAQQRNFGLSLPFKHEWIVMIDADERMTPELATEIEKEVASADSEVAMFRVRRRDIFMGRWLKRSSGYPTWFARVFRRGRVSVEREINEVYVPQGAAKQLLEHIDHYPFNKGIDWWFERHNRYSSMEAELLQKWCDHTTGSKSLRDPSERRAVLKGLTYRLPLRPYLIFIYLYVFRGGFLDGRPGWVFANMRLAYEIMIDAKAAYSNHSA